MFERDERCELCLGSASGLRQGSVFWKHRISAVSINTLLLLFQRRYSQMKSPGSSIPDFFKDDSSVLISCKSKSNYLDEETCYLICPLWFLSQQGFLFMLQSMSMSHELTPQNKNFIKNEFFSKKHVNTHVLIHLDAL
jgi:hypothetical protein